MIIDLKKRLMAYKKVEIHWLDSKGVTSDWEFLDEIEPFEPVMIVSMGFLFQDNDNYKTIIQSCNETQVLGRMTIPVCSIQQIIELKQIKKQLKGKRKCKSKDK